MKAKVFAAAASIAASIAWPLQAAAGKAHEHGVAQLEVAVEGARISVRFESPMDNLVGFEHAPRTAAQRDALAGLAKTLENPLALFAPDEAAGCAVRERRAESPLLGGNAGGGGSGHSDLVYEFALECRDPARLGALEVRALSAFRSLRTVRAQVAGPAGQRTQTLSKKNAVLRLR